MKEKIVLMYHDLYCISGTESGFQNENAFQYKIQVDEFEQQVATISAYCQSHSHTEVEFTFDDGGVSFLTLAAPILEKYGLRGTFFISTHYIDTPLFLTSNQLQELVERGHRIGSHSHTHSMLTHLTESEVADEWKISLNELAKYITGSENVVASIPNGDGNTTVIRKAWDAGINHLYTSKPTTNIKNVGGMVIYGRFVVYKGMTKEDVLSIIANKSKRKRIYLRWWCLQILKMLLGRGYDKLKLIVFRR